MTSEFGTAVAALSGTLVGGGLTLFGQAIDARRRAAADRAALTASVLAELADGATAVQIQATKQNTHMLRSALLKLSLVGNTGLFQLAQEWLMALDDLVATGNHASYLEISSSLERRMIEVARVN